MRLIIKNVYSAMLVLSIWLLTACQKDMGELHYANPSNFAGLAAFNGISLNNSLNMKIDEKFFSSDVDGFPPGSYIPYRTIFPGKRNISLQVKYVNSNLFKELMNFEADKLYSIFFYGSHKTNYLLSKDDLTVPKENEYKIRIVNLIEDEDVKLSIKKGDKGESQTMRVQVSDFRTEKIEPIHIISNLGNEEEPALSFSLNPVSKGIYTICLYEKVNLVNDHKEYKYYVIKY